MKGKRVALKYCGGCNPSYDRLEYVKKIQSIAGASIEWVTLDEDCFEAVLIIQGCEIACPGKEVASFPGRPVVSIRDNCLHPEDVVKILLQEIET